MLVYGAGVAWSSLFLHVADPIWSEPESAPGPRTSRVGAAKKVAAPQHWLRIQAKHSDNFVKKEEKKLFYFGFCQNSFCRWGLL